MRRLVTCFALGALALLAVACGDSKRDELFPNKDQTGVYLALGDSFAAGEGASNAELTSYVAIVRERVEAHLRHTVRLTSLAAGGQTTQDLIDTQLSEAVDILRGAEVGLVTLTIGGNDLYQYSADAGCLVDPASPDCPLRDGLAGVRERLDRILRELQAAGPDAVIAIELYPDLFSGSGHPFEGPAKTAFGLLDDVIADVARQRDVLLADPREGFLGRSNELTHINDTPADFHPNDAGHRIIAAAFLKALGIEKAD